MKNIIKQMQKTGVKRIIAIGGSGILNADENTLLIDHEDYPEKYIPIGKEHQKAYELLKDSGLDWTMIGSPEIIDNGPTGNYITAADYEPVPNKYRINAGDLVMFMLNELEKNPAVGCLNLDHVGAELAERLSSERTGNQLAHLDHFKAFEGSLGHHFVC